MTDRPGRIGRLVLGVVVVAAGLWWAGVWTGPEGVEPAEPEAAPVASEPSVEPGDPSDEAAEPSDLTPVEVECNLTARASYARLVEMADGEALGPVPVRTERDWVRFTPRQGAGTGWLHVDGFEPAAIAWVDGGCLEQVALERPPMGTVRGVVRGGEEGVDYTVGGERRAASVVDGAYELPLPVGDHLLSVHATFGQLFVRSEEVAVSLAEGEERVVNFDAPALPPLGWSLLEVDDGLRVMALLPGGLAASGGIEVGDRVQAVDGASAADLVAKELEWEDGPLVLEVLRDGVLLERTLAH